MTAPPPPAPPTINMAHRRKLARSAGPRQAAATPRRVPPTRLLGRRWRLEKELRRGPLVHIHAGSSAEGKDVMIRLLPVDTCARAAQERFIKAAMFLSGVDHPGLPEFEDFGYDAHARAYVLVTERCKGATLSALMAHNTSMLGLHHVLTVGQRLASTLYAIHSEGMVHGDVAPGNIILRQNNGVLRTRLFDLSTLRHVKGHSQHKEELWATPGYMAPELICDEPLTCSSDLYSLGALLYEMVSGAAPFVGSHAQVLRQHILEEPIALERVWSLKAPVHDGLTQLVGRLLAKKPGARPGSALEVWATLRALRKEVQDPTLGRTGVSWRAVRPLSAP